MRDPIRLRSLLLAVLVLGACSRHGRSPAPDEPRARGPSGYSIHEWGLFAVDVAAPTRAHAATEVAGGAPSGPSTSSYGHGGKPVLYVHLDPGVEEQRFDLFLRLPGARLAEQWPRGDAETSRIGWRGVVARARDCPTASRPPAPGSDACRSTRDGFCEASEIPRYSGARETCLSVGGSNGELLFYRATELPAEPLPLRLVATSGGFVVERTRDEPFEGLAFFLASRDSGRTVSALVLQEPDFGRTLEIPDAPGISRSSIRRALVDEAVARGLDAAEADAFVDAWAPAFFERRHRLGPEASGTVPSAFLQSPASLLYFVPQEVVDRMIPLESSPPARSTSRVFLARFVDGTRAIPQATTRAIAAELARGDVSAPEPDALPTSATVRMISSEVAPGGLASDDVRRVVQRHLIGLELCLEEALGRDPSLRGRVSVSYRVEADGSVSTARVDEGVGDARASSCFGAAVRRWRFPPPPSGGTTDVRFVFELADR